MTILRNKREHALSAIYSNKEADQTFFPLTPSIYKQDCLTNAYLLPLITKPTSSYAVISSGLRPISPLLGIRLPSAIYAAIAAPSPGNKALPKLKYVFKS